MSKNVVRMITNDYDWTLAQRLQGDNVFFASQVRAAGLGWGLGVRGSGLLTGLGIGVQGAGAGLDCRAVLCFPKLPPPLRHTVMPIHVYARHVTAATLLPPPHATAAMLLPLLPLPHATAAMLLPRRGGAVVAVAAVAWLQIIWPDILQPHSPPSPLPLLPLPLPPPTPPHQERTPPADNTMLRLIAFHPSVRFDRLGSAQERVAVLKALSQVGGRERGMRVC